jgi:hypothetical protein
MAAAPPPKLGLAREDRVGWTGNAAPSPSALAPPLTGAPPPVAAPMQALCPPSAVALPQLQHLPLTSGVHTGADAVVSVAVEETVHEVEDEVQEVGNEESSRPHVVNVDAHAQQSVPTSVGGTGGTGSSGDTLDEKRPRGRPVGTTKQAMAHKPRMTNPWARPISASVAPGPEREAMAHKLATQYGPPGLADALANCSGQRHVPTGQPAEPLAGQSKHGPDVELRGVGVPQRCQTCSGCVAFKASAMCGKCKACLDKPQFGGENKRKQACFVSRCLQPIAREPKPAATLNPLSDRAPGAAKDKRRSDSRLRLHTSARRAQPAAPPPKPSMQAGGSKPTREFCNWLQCDECGKWRVVSSALFASVSADARWT